MLYIGCHRLGSQENRHWDRDLQVGGLLWNVVRNNTYIVWGRQDWTGEEVELRCIFNKGLSNFPWEPWFFKSVPNWSNGARMSILKRALAWSNQQTVLLISGGMCALVLERGSELCTLVFPGVHPLHPSDILASSHLEELLQDSIDIFQKDKQPGVVGWRCIDKDTAWLKRRLEKPRWVWGTASSLVWWAYNVSREEKRKM